MEIQAMAGARALPQLAKAKACLITFSAKSILVNSG
jgi:hypothetical protein